MSSPDPQHLRDELVQLLDLQLRVLESKSLASSQRRNSANTSAGTSASVGCTTSFPNEKQPPLNDSRMGLERFLEKPSEAEEWNAGGLLRAEHLCTLLRFSLTIEAQLLDSGLVGWLK
jgi:hypothetical protein